jgi:hypothetical protein
MMIEEYSDKLSMSTYSSLARDVLQRQSLKECRRNLHYLLSPFGSLERRVQKMIVDEAYMAYAASRESKVQPQWSGL